MISKNTLLRICLWRGLILIAVGTVQLAEGQSPAPAPAAKPAPSRTLRIALTDSHSPLREIIVQTAEKEFQTVTLDPYRLSEPLTLKSQPTQLNFLGKPPGSVPTQPIATVAVPEAMRHLLVVLEPDSTKESGAHLAFVLNEADFPSQSIWFLNGTPRSIAIQLGNEWQTIVPGASHLLRPSAKDGEALGVQMVFYEKEKWRAFSSTRWSLPRGQRHLVFFNVNPRTQRMDYNSLTDYLPY